MIRPLSMTALGRGEHTEKERTWVVEIRSVNHRFCDIKTRLPREYAALEERIKKEIKNRYNRGHIDVAVTTSGRSTDTARLEVNLPMAQNYLDCMKKIQAELGLAGEIDISQVLGWRDVLVAGEQEEDLEETWLALRIALNLALDSAQQMRENEGTALKADLLAMLDNITTAVEEIAGAVPDLVREREALMQERLTALLDGVDLDPARLAQEVAILADKSDVTEEVVRLRSHIKQFQDFLGSDEPVGRRLDFLLQEFNREINTIASKINNSQVAHRTVELKNEAEKMREQVQNLE